MKISRRKVMAASVPFLMGADRSPPKQAWGVRLGTFARANNLVAAGLIVRRHGETLFDGAVGSASGMSPEEWAAGVLHRPFTTSTSFRVASMSKTVSALTILRLAETGLVSLDDDVRGVLRGRFTQSAEPLTLRQLLTHTSGVRDPDTYWVPLPQPIETVITEHVWNPAASRDRFEYANLNTALAATVTERVTGQRFDRLAHTTVLEPAELDAGFNWSMVSTRRRRNGATLYRQLGRVWVVQADGPATLAGDGPAVLTTGGAALNDYVPGQNGTLFSPHGGLRASLQDLVRMAAMVRQTPSMHAVAWRRNEGGDNGMHDEAFFDGVGLGTLIFCGDRSFWRRDTVIGHHGEAYGLHGAWWTVPRRKVDIAYAAIGVPEGRLPATGHPTLNAMTAPLVALAQEIVAAAR